MRRSTSTLRATEFGISRSLQARNAEELREELVVGMSITFFASIDLTSPQVGPSYDANCKVLNGSNTASFTRIRAIFCWR